MKNRKLLWLIVGVVLLIAGVALLEKKPLAGVLLFILGVGVLFLAAIGAMRLSGSVKENFFQKGGGAAEKFEVQNAEPQENVWDQLTENQKEQK